MVHIVLIEPCFLELEKIKAQIVEEKKAKGDTDKTTYSECVCLLIHEYYSSKRMGEGNLVHSVSSSLVSSDNSVKGLGGASPPVFNNDLSENSTTRLKFDVLEKDYEKFLALNMKFYVLHQNDLDDVPIALEDGKHMVFVETSFVPEYRKFMNENNFMGA